MRFGIFAFYHFWVSIHYQRSFILKPSWGFIRSKAATRLQMRRSLQARLLLRPKIQTVICAKSTTLISRCNWTQSNSLCVKVAVVEPPFCGWRLSIATYNEKTGPGDILTFQWNTSQCLSVFSPSKPPQWKRNPNCFICLPPFQIGWNQHWKQAYTEAMLTEPRLAFPRESNLAKIQEGLRIWAVQLTAFHLRKCRLSGDSDRSAFPWTPSVWRSLS